jgi:hypothetical protein
MRRLLYLLVCLFTSFTAFSQTDGNYNYSIGIKAFSLVQLPKILNQTNSQDYSKVFYNGAVAKFNDNQISYRLIGNYFRKSMTFANQCESCEIADGKVTNYSFTIGFEKNFNYAKIQPYFGADMGFLASRYTGEIKTVNPKSSSMPYNVDTDKNGFVISPILGIKVNPINNLSIFAETAMMFYYSYERQETIQQDALNTRSFVKYNKWEYLLSPITIGAQVNLNARN